MVRLAERCASHLGQGLRDSRSPSRVARRCLVSGAGLVGDGLGGCPSALELLVVWHADESQHFCLLWDHLSFCCGRVENGSCSL